MRAIAFVRDRDSARSTVTLHPYNSTPSRALLHVDPSPAGAASRARSNATRCRSRSPTAATWKCSACAIRARAGCELSVDERGARLTMPPRASLVSGERFLAEHRDWLAAQLDRYTLDATRRRCSATSPRLAAARRAACRCTGSDGRFTAWCNAMATDAGCSPCPRAPATRRCDARCAISTKARRAPTSAAGCRATCRRCRAPPRRVPFKRMSSQWGSLAPDGNVVLDLSLVLARPSAFEYVLVHELCHLIRADHSRSVLARGGGAVPGVARRARLFPRRRAAVEGDAASAAGLSCSFNPQAKPSGVMRLEAQLEEIADRVGDRRRIFHVQVVASRQDAQRRRAAAAPRARGAGHRAGRAAPDRRWITSVGHSMPRTRSRTCASVMRSMVGRVRRGSLLQA